MNKETKFNLLLIISMLFLIAVAIANEEAVTKHLQIQSNITIEGSATKPYRIDKNR